MRNLKRVLSLTVVSVMLLGMMVIGSSAAQDYSDVDYENDNIEAIEVLDAINVMRGDLDANGELAGTFRPGSDVKRSETARIMAFLMDLDYDYYVGVNPFSDMVGHWAEKYAAACAANGIIYGRGDGIYDPVVIDQNAGHTDEVINLEDAGSDVVVVITKPMTVNNVPAGVTLVIGANVKLTGKIATEDLVVAPGTTVTLARNAEITGKAAESEIFKDKSGAPINGTLNKSDIVITTSTSAVATGDGAAKAAEVVNGILGLVTADTAHENNSSLAGIAETVASAITGESQDELDGEFELEGTTDELPSASSGYTDNATLPLTVTSYKTSELSGKLTGDIPEGTKHEVDIVTSGKNITVTIKKSLNLEAEGMKSLTIDGKTLEVWYTGVEKQPKQLVILHLKTEGDLYLWKEDWHEDGNTAGTWIKISDDEGEGGFDDDLIYGNNKEDILVAFVATTKESTESSSGQSNAVYEVETSNIITIKTIWNEDAPTPVVESDAETDH